MGGVISPLPSPICVYWCWCPPASIHTGGRNTTTCPISCPSPPLCHTLQLPHHPPWPPPVTSLGCPPPPLLTLQARSMVTSRGKHYLDTWLDAVDTLQVGDGDGGGGGVCVGGGRALAGFG